ncbi:MAG TPA: AAA family ATPase [Archangium sp.]|uniref:AAA family ATPase n=1 Tax=Archangium sp. TaxID=1872627 RepID=UPI002E338F58|nr:AAA family ATPase [Archangium sp.]HEX5753042.1 AAA family ATPase [Archangium sp.]
MRIDRLYVRNFKGFEERTFTFPRSLDAPADGNGSFHVIIGQNGRGKTSALDALAVAVGSWFLGVRGEDSRHIRLDDVRVRVIEFRETQRIEKQLPVVVEATGRVQGKDYTWKREFAGKRTTWVNAKNIKTSAEIAVEKMQRGEEVTLPLISYYGTGRLWLEPKDVRAEAEALKAGHTPQEVPAQETEEDLAESFASRLAGYRFSIDPRCSPRDLLRWLKFEQQIANVERRESIQFRVVKQAIQDAVEGCRRIEYHPRLGLLLDIEGQPRLPFGALSDGQRNVIAMVGDLAFKAAQLNPHLDEKVLLKTPGIVLIDEIDLHLHPRWQRHVMDDLRRLFPEVQFIATTHSPFIVQTAREGELIPLDVQPVAETENLGLEEIARGLMRVERPEVSPRYRQMVDVAKNYLTLLDEAEKAPAEKLRDYVERLAADIAPYADNPAFQAFLELKREATLGARLEAMAEQVQPGRHDGDGER